MDHYNEQLVKKATEPSDIIKRVLIAAGTILVIFFIIFGMIVFGSAALLILVFGAFYLSWYLLTGTITEYEYIVTNLDMDIDKISGRRKRKRLITVDLGTVTEWGEYTENKSVKVNATVMASDATGSCTWYLLAKHKKLGDIMVLFSPTEETAYNINQGVPYNIRKNDISFENAEEGSEADEDNETDDNSGAEDKGENNENANKD